MLILDSLGIDDEPISLIIKETKIEDYFRSRLKKHYRELEISELNVIEAINELYNEDMIMIYELNDKDGKESKDSYKIEFSNKNNEDMEYLYLKITEKGSKWFDAKYDQFWND